MFVNFCDNTPFNSTFWRESERHSIWERYDFTRTKSYEEAEDLLNNGWEEKAVELTKLMAAKEKDMLQPTYKSKTVSSVEGYQAIVPMYLNNQPNAMISKRSVPVKDKVVTLVKSIGYNGGTSTSTIMEESIKALQVIKKLEANGVRVNLYVVCYTYTSEKR